MSTKLHGKNGMVSLGGELVFGTKWTLDIGRPLIDVSVFGDTWAVNAPGLHEASGTFDGFFDVDGDASLSAAMGGAVTIEVWAANHNGSVHKVAHGYGFVDASASAAVDDMVRCSGRFKSTGPWSLG